MSTNPTAYSRQYRRDLRRQWRREGRCIDCGHVRDRPGLVMCNACIARVAQRRAARYWPWRAVGLCGICGQPAEGRSLCPPHLADERRRQNARNAMLRAEHAAYQQRTGRRLTLTAYVELRATLRDDAASAAAG
jgi:hypothetical protein